MLGQILNDRYKIQSELGQGGMGTVYRAHDETLNRDVAVKILSNFKLGTQGKARLLHEAQLVAQLDHPNIVTVFDAGEVNGAPFIVMQLVAGNTLDQQPPQDLNAIVAVARQICAALQHAHEQSIIHRDLKPENLVVDSNGAVKLMDFGLARSISSRMSIDGAVVGTVFYMPPEQAMGAEVDQRADLYSLGVILYELTTGALPFEDPDPIAVISQHIHAPIVPPRARRPEIPPGLNDLIEKLLSKEPSDRPASAAEVISSLESPNLLDESAAPSEELSVLERIVRGRMVGRQKEFQEARTLWKKVASGDGHFLLISGEPGIGKTRLTRETATHAEVSGGCVLSGACYTEGGAPYAAFGQIIRQFFAQDPNPGLDIPDYIMADLITLAPDLAPRFPEISPNPKLDAQLEQQRIFESVSTFFRLLSALEPLLIIIEDVHWADSATLLLLIHLARQLRTDAIMLIANYREVELDESHPFHQVLLDINRERLATRIKLARLDHQQTSDLLASMFNDESTPEFLDGIYHETEGNPFFIEEVCKSLVETGKLYFEDGEWHRPAMADLEVPQSIRIAIQARIGKLADGFQNVLRLAAVFGHEFDFEILSRAAAQDEDSLIDALEAAEKAQLIRANPKAGPNAFAFVHALIPSTIYENINTLRRGRLHSRAADAIQQVHPNNFEQLAYHFIGAGDLENAVESHIHAADRAQQLFALDAAIRHLLKALDLLDPDGHAQERSHLLERLGELRSEFGEKLQAIEDYLQVLDLMPSLNQESLPAAIRLHRKIIETGLSISWYEDFQEIQSHYEASIKTGLELSERLPPHPEIVFFLSVVAEDAVRRRVPLDFKLAKEYADNALGISQTLGDPKAQSAALGAFALVAESLGNYQEIIEASQKRLAILKEQSSPNPIEQVKVSMLLGLGLIAVGDFQRALSELSTARGIAAEIQAVHEEVLTMVYQSFASFQLDRWDEVLTIDDEWRAMQARYPNFLDRVYALCFQIGLAATVHALRGDFEKAQSLRKESNDFMLRHDGPSERWGLNNYI